MPSIGKVYIRRHCFIYEIVHGLIAHIIEADEIPSNGTLVKTPCGLVMPASDDRCHGAVPSGDICYRCYVRVLEIEQMRPVMIELEDYVKAHEAAADEKEEEAPASAEMHRSAVEYSKSIGRAYTAFDWPDFCRWLAHRKPS